MGNPSVHFTGLAVLVTDNRQEDKPTVGILLKLHEIILSGPPHIGPKNLNQKLHCFTPPGSAGKFPQTVQTGQTIYRKGNEMILGKLDLIFICIDLGNEVFRLKE